MSPLQPFVRPLGIALFATAGWAQGPSFTPGEILFASPAIPGMPTTTAGVLRIDPQTGATSVFMDIWSIDGRQDVMAYDAFRDQIVIYAQLTGPFGPEEVHLIDAGGNVTTIGYDTNDDVQGFAPASGGRIYFKRGAFFDIHYIDAANQPHVLLDASGTQPFQAPGGDLGCMEYEAATNSLLIAVRSSDPWWNCGSTVPHSQVLRYRLSSDGARVVSGPECTPFVVDSSGGTSPMALSKGPNGLYLAAISFSAYQAAPRLQWLDPVGLTTGVFATNDYIGAGAINGAVWSHVLGRYVVFDAYGNVLRSYGFGEIGGGQVIATSLPISGGGSSEVASLVEILPAACGDLVATYCQAKTTSAGCVPTIWTQGSPSATAGAGFVVHASQVNANQFGILFYGLAGPAAVPFLGGTLCVRAPLVRTPAVNSGGVGACGGVLSMDFNAHVAGGANPQLGAGSVVHAQWWFRDPAHPIGGSGLSDAITFTVCP